MFHRAEDEVTQVLLSERLLFSGTRPLNPNEAVGQGKALLVRSTVQPVRAPATLHLDPIVSEADWQDYAQRRVLLEAGFGVDEPSARVMILTLRQRAEHLGLVLFLARDGGQAVGAIALPPAGRSPVLGTFAGGRRLPSVAQAGLR